MAIVTAYDTLGESGLQHSLVQTEAKAIFLNPHLLKNLHNSLVHATEIKYVIYSDDSAVNQSDIDTLQTLHPAVRILSWSQFLDLGRANPVEPDLPDREDLCCIMYTSGSTGNPKGVLLKHKNVVAAGKLFRIESFPIPC